MTRGPGGPYRVVVGLTCASVSGVDVFCTHLVRSLRARGIPAHVLLSQPDQPWIPLPLPEDVPQVRLPVGRSAWWAERWRAVVQHLESQAPCVYLPNYDYRHSCVSPLLSRDVSIVGIVHSDDPVHYEHVERLGRFWDAVVAVTPEIARTIEALQPKTVDRLVTIPYGIPLPSRPSRARPDDGPVTVAYAGRLDFAQKRVQDLAPIFERLATQGIPARLTIIGDGPDGAALRRACESLERGGSVAFAGTLPNAAVLREFEAAHTVILPSEFEGLPLCLLEAMSRGCVPVVTNVRSGVRALVNDGVNGFILPVGDIAGFAARLTDLQQDAGLRRMMSDRATRAVTPSDFGLETMTERYVALFRRVVGAARSGRFRRPRSDILPPPGLHLTWRDRLPSRLGAALSRAAAGFGESGRALSVRRR